MTHGSLFSGIEGFGLAAHWMGWRNAFHCEWNAFGQHVAKYYWPDAESFNDITKTDFKKYANKIDILTGGFPCQPYSTAGKRLGKDDSRHLWPEMLRAIREIRPRWVIGENVLGLVSWNGGLVFDEVQTDLENEGFEVWPVVLPAAGVNAPHQRYRVWFIAHSKSERTGEDFGRLRSLSNGHSERVQTGSAATNSDNKRTSNEFGKIQSADGEIPKRDHNAEFGDAGDGLTENPHNDGRSNNKREEKPSIRGQRHTGAGDNDWSNFPTVPPVCTGDDGFSDILDADTVRKIAASMGKTRIKNPYSWWRTESIKAGGNAIVPEVAYQIFQTIEMYELL